MTWNPTLARNYIDVMIDGYRRAVNDRSDEIARLEEVTDDDLRHPALMRSFVRGACGFDIAKDCTMTFFYALCLGDYGIYHDLVDKHEAFSRDWSDKAAGAAWHAAQDAFWARPDIAELERMAESVPAL